MNVDSSIASEPDVAAADNPDEGQRTNPTNCGPTNGAVSERKRTANRANSGKSTGPTSKMGKRIASLNSFKNGYYSKERRHQLMAELDEDPADRERLCKDLYASYPPGAPIEDMLLDALADDFWQLGRLDRKDASVQLRELQNANLDEWRREEQNESYAVTYVKSEISKGGLVKQDDSAGKFRHILGILGQQLEIAKRRAGSMADQPQWKLLYGINDANRLGEDMFQKFCRGAHISDAEYVEVVGFLEDELDSYHRAWIRYKVEHQQETVASREARLVTCGGDALILFKEMEVTNRQIDRKLQLLLKVRAERVSRQSEVGSRQSAEGGSNRPDGDPDGGSAEIPPRKPVQRAAESGVEEATKAKGKGQRAKGKSEDRMAGQECTFDLQPSTFDNFSKNEATDLLDNKAPAEIRNEATVQTGMLSALRLLVFVFWLPSALRVLLSVFRRQAARLGKGRTFDLQPSTFDFLKNEATDLLDNKGSASAEIRNEATVEGSRQPAVGSQQSPDTPPTASVELLPAAFRLLPTAFCLLPTAFRLLPTAFRRPPTVPCILAGEKSSALAGVLLCSGNRRRSAGSVRPVPCPARGSKHSLHASGGQPLPAGRADRATPAPAADGSGLGTSRLRLRGRGCCDAVRVPLPSQPCQPFQLRGRVRPERSRPHRRPAGINPAPHSLWPSIRSGNGIGPKRRTEKCRIGPSDWRTSASRIGCYNFGTRRFRPRSLRTRSFRENPAAAGSVRRPRHGGLGRD